MLLWIEKCTVIKAAMERYKMYNI